MYNQQVRRPNMEETKKIKEGLMKPNILHTQNTHMPEICATMNKCTLEEIPWNRKKESQ